MKQTLVFLTLILVTLMACKVFQGDAPPEYPQKSQDAGVE